MFMYMYTSTCLLVVLVVLLACQAVLHVLHKLLQGVTVGARVLQTAAAAAACQ